METDGGDTNSGNDNDPSTAQSHKPFRIKMYPSTFSGPFVVYFRKKEKPINVLLISSEVYKLYKSVKEIKKISLDKLRVVFGSRNDANDLLNSKLFFNLYRVYAPCDSCEINGIIYDEFLDCSDVINHGSGIFKNKSIKAVKILDCTRLSKLRYSDKETKYEHSNCIKVTFAGSILPDFVLIDNVIFNVRLYFPKLMHCNRCLLFGHTSHFCSNKPKCSKCGDVHNSSDCEKQSDVCIYCRKIHHSFKDCSVFISNQQKFNQQLKNKNRLSYSEVIKSSDNFISLNTFEPLLKVEDENVNEINDNFVYKPPSKRKRNHSSPKRQDYSCDPQPSTSYDNNFPHLVPPSNSIPNSQNNIHNSFRNNYDQTNTNTNLHSNECNDNSVLSILEDLIELLGLSDFWKNIIKKCLPFLASILEKINSFWPLISSFFSS